MEVDKNRNTTSILTEIIHPNNSIADGFDNYTITFKNNTTLTGIVTSESSRVVTVRQMGGLESTISKNDIKSMEKAKQSAMPNGFENSIDPQKMNDLIAFIKQK